MSKDWSNATPDEIFRDFVRLVADIRNLDKGMSDLFVVSEARLAKLGFPLAKDPELTAHVWRGHRFVVSEDARAVSRACADALRSVRG